jgi:hypothetical protein
MSKLALGLRFIQQVISQEGYDAWVKLLDICRRPHIPHDYNPSRILNEMRRNRPFYRYLGLSSNQEEDELIEWNLRDIPYWRLQRLTDAPFGGNTEGIQSFPYRFWLASNLDGPYYQSIASWDNRLLRECGYVMWEYVSEDVMDDTEKLGILLDKAKKAHEPRFERARASLDEIFLSWKRREIIYFAGGKGWWAEGDFSKLEGLTEQKKLELQETFRAQDAEHEASKEEGDI